MTPDAEDDSNNANSADSQNSPVSADGVFNAMSERSAHERWVQPTVDGVFKPAPPSLDEPSTAIHDVQFEPAPHFDPAPHLDSAPHLETAASDALGTRSVTTLTAPTSSAASSAMLGEDELLPAEDTSGLRTMVEWIAVVLAALAIALFIKAYLVQAFEIPSGSMQTTLNIDDRILVNKLSYVVGDVERDNLIVFRKLEGTQSDTNELIKRVVALPGETIEVRDDGLLYVYTSDSFNAIQLDQSYLDPANRLLPAPNSATSADQNIWHPNCTNAEGNGSRCTLDDSSYFGMGDNRGASTDSRSFGPIPEENLVGRAFARIWPLTEIGGL